MCVYIIYIYIHTYIYHVISPLKPTTMASIHGPQRHLTGTPKEAMDIAETHQAPAEASETGGHLAGHWEMGILGKRLVNGLKINMIDINMAIIDG